MQLSEQEVIRRQSLEELVKLGINPYPLRYLSQTPRLKKFSKTIRRRQITRMSPSPEGS